MCGFILITGPCILAAAPPAPTTTSYRDIETVYRRAAFLVMEKRYQEAIEIFEEINQINPYIAEIHGNLGYLYETVGQPESAISEYRTALDIDPQYSDALNNLGYLLARRQENVTEALELCRQAVFLDSDNPAYRDSLGYALLVTGDISEAFIQFERALFYDKTTASAYYHLGLIYYRQQELEKSRQQFVKAVTYRDCPAMAYLRLAQVLVEMGNLSEAMEVLEKARWTVEKGWLSPSSRMELEDHLECFLRMGLWQGLVEVEHVRNPLLEQDANYLTQLPLSKFPPDARVFLDRESRENYHINQSGLIMCRKHGYNPMAAVLRDRVRAQLGPYLERKGRLLARVLNLALTRKEIKERGVKTSPGRLDLSALEQAGYLPAGFGRDYIFTVDDVGEITFTITEGALASVTIPPGIDITTIAEAQAQVGDSSPATPEVVADGSTPFDDLSSEGNDEETGYQEADEPAADGEDETITAPPPPQPSIDYIQFIQAPGLVPVSPLFTDGWAIRQKITASGQVMENYYAIIGEEGSSWRIEHVGPALIGMSASFPDLKTMLMGLLVDKQSGKVLRAVLGKPGEKGKSIKISVMPDMPVAEPPVPLNEDVTIGLGIFPSKKYVTTYGASWTGVEGDLEEVLLKSESSGQSFELAELPSWADAVVSEVDLSLSVRKYTNGMEYHIVENEVIAAFYPLGKAGETNQGIYKMVTVASTQEIVLIKTDTKAQLKW